MRQRRIRLALLALGIMLLLLAVLLPALALVLTDSGQARNLAAIVQSAVTAFAILAGGGFAAYKLEVFRDFEPHLTIDHDISHRRVSDSYVHIAVSVTLRNTSRVRVDIIQGLFRLYQVAPLSDESVERLYAETYSGTEIPRANWPILFDSEFARAENVIFVEPGGTHQETIDFFVTKDTESVAVYTHFENSLHTGTSQSGTGWYLATVYDILSSISQSSDRDNHNGVR